MVEEYNDKMPFAFTGTLKKFVVILEPDKLTEEERKALLAAEIQAASVNTGSGMKDGKLKSKDFFNVKDDPYITFKSTCVTQTGPATFSVPGTFTVRGVSQPETLTSMLRAKGPARPKLKEPWPSIGRSSE